MTGDERSDPLSDVINLFAAPLAGTIRSFDQFRKGVDEFLRGVENFNRTMENLNETAERINVLLAEVEEPIKAAIPQVTRTVKAGRRHDAGGERAGHRGGTGADASSPRSLSTPGFGQLPAQLSQFTDVMTEMSKRLGPLTQFAESAGGLFGGLRFPGMAPRTATARQHPRSATGRSASSWRHGRCPPRPCPGGSAPSRPLERRSAPEDGDRKPHPEAAAKKSAAKKSAAKKSAAKKSTAKKSTATGNGDAVDRSLSRSADERRRHDVARQRPCRARRSPPARPAPCRGGRKANAMPCPSTGEKLPLVTSPTATPSIDTEHPARAGRRPSVAMPNSRRAMPCGRSARAASRPRNDGLSHATTQPSPACSDVMPGPSS